ncbi:hypothetical protein [Mesorhizobium sp.]|uniref:hypothetical protein n=1 Tax=Mesorhizobium sp. TaxID=1871066 RepID=UPI00122B4E29|nr:hypothetical protein [Mesorhizobium sp.]TIS49174.1 MAG: hypothetical protein E5W96_15675 [Mesorhizobium sp.]
MARRGHHPCIYAEVLQRLMVPRNQDDATRYTTGSATGDGNECSNDAHLNPPGVRAASGLPFSDARYGAVEHDRAGIKQSFALVHVQPFAMRRHADPVIAANAAGPTIPFVLGGVEADVSVPPQCGHGLRVLVAPAGEF